MAAYLPTIVVDEKRRSIYQHLQRGHQWKPPHYLGISIGQALEALGKYTKVELEQGSIRFGYCPIYIVGNANQALISTFLKCRSLCTHPPLASTKRPDLLQDPAVPAAMSQGTIYEDVTLLLQGIHQTSGASRGLEHRACAPFQQTGGVVESIQLKT